MERAMGTMTLFRSGFLACCLVLVIGMIGVSPAGAAPTPTEPSSGNGTEVNPYKITNIEELYWITRDSSRWDKHYQQTADIDISGSSIWDDGEDRPQMWQMS